MVFNLLSNLAFFIFYFGMICGPITGYVLMNIEGKQISFFGYNLPELIDQNKNYEILSHQIHAIMGDLILYTFLLHILAADTIIGTEKIIVSKEYYLSNIKLTGKFSRNVL